MELTGFISDVSFLVNHHQLCFSCFKFLGHLIGFSNFGNVQNVYVESDKKVKIRI